MTTVPVRGTVRKQVSDGNYGTEAVEITIERWIDEEEDEDGTIGAMLIQARRYVHAELARSPSAKVRASVITPPLRPPDPADIDDDDVAPLPF